MSYNSISFFVVFFGTVGETGNMTAHTPEEMEANILKILEGSREGLDFLTLCPKYLAIYNYGSAYMVVPGMVKKMVKKGLVEILPSGWSWWKKWRDWSDTPQRIKHNRIWDGHRIVRIKRSPEG